MNFTRRACTHGVPQHQQALRRSHMGRRELSWSVPAHRASDAPAQRASTIDFQSYRKYFLPSPLLRAPRAFQLDSVVTHRVKKG